MRALALAVGAAASAVALTPDDLLSQMTLAQKIGQLTQLDVSAITTNDAVDPAKLAAQIGQYGVGSIINTMFTGGCNAQSPGGLTQAQWRALIGQVQNYVLHNTTQTTPPIPLIWGLDSVHGGNYIANSTLFPHK